MTKKKRTGSESEKWKEQARVGKVGSQRERRSVPTHGVFQVFQEEFKSTALPQPRTAISFEKGCSCLNVKNIFSEMMSCRVKIRLEKVRQRDAALGDSTASIPAGCFTKADA